MTIKLEKYRKRPVIIEAIRYDISNQKEICKWCNGQPAGGRFELIGIDTLEGRIFASPGDYIIKGVKGEFYPCKPDIFNVTYDWVPE